MRWVATLAIHRIGTFAHAARRGDALAINGADLRPFLRSMGEGNLAAPKAVPVRFETLGVKVFRRDFASSYGWWGNIAVVLGRQPPEAAHVVNYRACVVELHKQFPQGVGLITVVNDTSTPSADGRDAMIKMFKEIWPLMTAVLFVPNADGFKAAVLHSVMGGLILATGQRDRVRVERSLPVGMPWFAGKLLGEDSGALQKALQTGIQRFCEAESAPPSSSIRSH